jgi:chromosome segregation ATPase
MEPKNTNLEELQAALDRARDNAMKLARHADSLQAQVDGLRKIEDKLNAETETLKAKLDQRDHETVAFESRLACRDDTISSLTRGQAERDAVIANNRKQIDTLTNYKNGLLRDVKNAQESEAKLSAELATVREAYGTLAHQFNVVRQESEKRVNEVTRNAVKVHAADVEQLTLDLKNERARLDEAHKGNKDLLRTVDELRRERDALKCAVDVLRDTLFGEEVQP